MRLVPRLLKTCRMTGKLFVVFAFAMASCTDEAPPPNTPIVEGVESAAIYAAEPAWPCPVGSECPQPIDCAALGELKCLERADCEAVYAPVTATGTAKQFAYCEDRTKCAAEGDSCNATSTTPTCCPGLYCCGSGGPGAGTGDACYSACPL